MTLQIQMYQLLVLIPIMVNGQIANSCNNESCLHPPGCKTVTLDPKGVDPCKSPFYATMFSNVTGVDTFDNVCSMFFELGPAMYMVANSVVFKNSSYTIQYNLLGDIDGSPGAYRLEQTVPIIGCGCVYNDYILKVLEGECEGISLTYRCYVNGECIDRYRDQIILYGFSSALVPCPVPTSCETAIMDVASQQGLACLPPVFMPNRLHRRCVTRINGLTAINAYLIAEEDSVEI